MLNPYKTWITRILRALIANEGRLSEPQAAALVNLSPRSFRRNFTSFFGRTFRYVRFRVRMRAAQRLLRSTSLSIAEISERLGYSGREKLDRAFHRQFGVSPAVYQKNCKSMKNGRSGHRQVRNVSANLRARSTRVRLGPELIPPDSETETVERSL